MSRGRHLADTMVCLSSSAYFMDINLCLVLYRVTLGIENKKKEKKKRPKKSINDAHSPLSQEQLQERIVSLFGRPVEHGQPLRIDLTQDERREREERRRQRDTRGDGYMRAHETATS